MSLSVNGIIRLSRLAGLISLALSPFYTIASSAPNIMQSRALTKADLNTLKFDSDSVSEYLISEKLDGIRAHWTGKNLLTRSGKIIHAPSWFTAGFPSAVTFEGELWLERDSFQSVSKIVLDKKPNNLHWKNVQFRIFDSASIKGGFGYRYQQLVTTVADIQSPYINVIPQRRVDDINELTQMLIRIEDMNGEGLMLHHQDNVYLAGKSHDYFKLKQYQDSEATVIGYEGGSGKYEGKMGAIWVLTVDNIKFKIGTGFSDTDRASPPPIGSIIQFRYNGLTDSGIPRFARYLRQRTTPDS
ncbi:DNA ligase [Thaumasiovibrio sp. DFM-14]|uniref:DNA ligase n=1 Tax=Thaumasiovibrio sp. DFM-14 TaxID=3384792 RepID=UPI0039A02E54